MSTSQGCEVDTVSLCSQVDTVGLRYKCVNVGEGKSPGSQHWCAQIDGARDIIRDNVSIKWVYTVNSLHKIVNLLYSKLIVNHLLTILWGSCLSQTI